MSLYRDQNGTCEIPSSTVKAVGADKFTFKSRDPYYDLPLIHIKGIWNVFNNQVLLYFPYNGNLTSG